MGPSFNPKEPKGTPWNPKEPNKYPNETNL